MSTEENQLNVQGYNIVTILKRLETATSRLEDITIFQEEAMKKKGLPKQLTPSVSAPVTALAPSAASSPQADQSVEKTKSTLRFEEFVEENVKPVVEISSKIDAVVAEAAELLYQAFVAQAEFLHLASQAKKPEMTDSALVEALKPINEKIEKIGALKDANRTSKFFNHLNTIAEGSPVLSWVLTPTPVSTIPEYKDSAQFWSNRILKEYKDKDETQAEWVKKFLSFFNPLKDYAKEFHTKGTKWNPDGKPLSELLKASKSAGSSAPPPPPPPPPPANLFDSDTPAKESPAAGMNAVFADLNKGENITSGLKKVDRSQMTHKNPELRKAAPAVPMKPTPPKKPSALSSSVSHVPTKKAARKELVDGSKWIIENYSKADLGGEAAIVIEADMNQSIFIGNSTDVVIQVKGKANAISLSNTKSVSVVVDSLISGIELIKAHKFGLQILGTVADVNVDQCDEGSIYISQESIDADTQIYTSSSTALNIYVPKDDDYVELAAPEQFKHSIKGGKLVSEVVVHVA